MYEYIKGKININQFQSLSNKNNLKPTDSTNNDNDYNYQTIEPKEEEKEKEKENKTFHPTLSGNSKTFKTIPILKENEKNVSQKKEKIKNLISLDYLNNNNSDIKLMRNRQTLDIYSKIDAFSLNDKSSYRNLYSEQSHQISKGKEHKEIKDIKELKSISLNVDGNEILNINANEPKNIKYKSIIQNVKNIIQNKQTINQNNNRAKNDISNSNNKANNKSHIKTKAYSRPYIKKPKELNPSLSNEKKWNSQKKNILNENVNDANIIPLTNPFEKKIESDINNINFFEPTKNSIKIDLKKISKETNMNQDLLKNTTNFENSKYCSLNEISSLFNAWQNSSMIYKKFEEKLLKKNNFEIDKNTLEIITKNSQACKELSDQKFWILYVEYLINNNLLVNEKQLLSVINEAFTYMGYDCTQLRIYYLQKIKKYSPCFKEDGSFDDCDDTYINKLNNSTINFIKRQKGVISSKDRKSVV